jgi:peptide/nickel transport system permease protein
MRPYSRLDYTVNLLAFAGISTPPFWLALLLILVFAVVLGILPAGGMGTVGGGSIWDQARFLVLPVASLTIASIGGHTRYMRAAMIETLRQDYVRTARAKGLSESRVVVGHALRNALIPVVTIIALDFGTLFSGALVTETIFAYPGMGRLIFDAIMGNDFNLALVALLFATVLTLAANILADVGYVALDRRISFREVER